MLKRSTSEDIKSSNPHPVANTWKVTGKTPLLKGKWSANQVGYKKLKNGLNHANSTGSLQDNATITRQNKALEQLERKRKKLTSILHVISPEDRKKSLKKVEKMGFAQQKRKLVKELYPPPSVPKAAEVGLPIPIYNHEEEAAHMSQPEWFALKAARDNHHNAIMPKSIDFGMDSRPDIQEPPKKASIEALNRLLDDLKLFSDESSPIPSPVRNTQSIGEEQRSNISQIFPPKAASNHIAKNALKRPNPKIVQFQKDSPPLPRLDLESQTHVDQFAINLARSPKLIRQFLALQTSGLSPEEQRNIIHEGFKLESKILELVEQYNKFMKELGTELLR